MVDVARYTLRSRHDSRQVSFHWRPQTHLCPENSKVQQTHVHAGRDDLRVIAFSVDQSMGMHRKIVRQVEPVITINSQGPSKPEALSNFRSSPSISCQAASFPAASRPASIVCRAPNDSFSKRR
jgi:hypothetical protein